jgi:hypothetical protein
MRRSFIRKVTENEFDLRHGMMAILTTLTSGGREHLRLSSGPFVVPFPSVRPTWKFAKPASQAAGIKEVSIERGIFVGVRSSGRNGVALSRDLTKQHKGCSVNQRRHQCSQ